MKHRKVVRLSLTLLLSLLCGISYAQTQNVLGLVSDSKGESLMGVNVSVVGTKTGTVTDLDGKYSINVSSNAKLQFSFVGYKSKTVAVAGQSQVNVTLEESDKSLDEVVVIGYGVVKKRDLTGSVSSIKSGDLAKVSTSNAMQAMQAKVPGLDIQQSSGESGAGISMTLRGNRSISATNSPLVLVDGIEYGSTLDIDPSDIESMEVLKDASSTAIYGTKGANGVIIITTKHGKAGKTKVNFNAYWSSNSPTDVSKVMYGTKEVQRLIDKSDYQTNYKTYAASGTWGTASAAAADVLTESLSDGTTQMSIYNDGSYTDWLDIILKNGMTQNYDVAISGGNDLTQYNISAGVMRDAGLMKNDVQDRYNGRVNIDHQINKIFKVGTNILFTYKDHDKRNSSVYSQALKMTTITHPYLTDGTMNETPNPFYAAHCNPLLDEIPGAFQNNIKTSRFFGNVYLQINPIKNMTFKSMFALDETGERTGLYQDYKSVARYQIGSGYISNTWDNTTKYTWENTLNYMTDFGHSRHSLTAMLGHSMSQSVLTETSTYGSTAAEHYYKSSFYDLTKITSPTNSNQYVKSSMLSFFGRLNYSYKDRYLLTTSLRTDGSSALADGHKWGSFPSVAAAWRIIDEPWMEKISHSLSNLKLRASWGLSGNAAIDAYSTLAKLSSDVYYYTAGSDVAGKFPNSISNSNLTWEKTSAYNFGLDFGLANNRISGSVDFYINHTYDLLYYKSAPASCAFPNMLGNVGKTKGHGLEVALNTLIVKSRDFSWDVNWSYSMARDKITKLADGVTQDINGTTGLIVGQPVSTYYDYETNGCWGIGEFAQYLSDWKTRHPDGASSFPSTYGLPGTLKVVDRNDDGTIDSNDRRVYKRSPNYIVGMNNTLTYKNFTLSFLVYARVGGWISYDMNNQLNYESANWGDLDYWTPTNTNAKFPNPGADKTTYSTYSTALKYEKADYLKFKDITLSYDMPKSLLSKVGVGSLRFYGSLKNFFTISHINNYDPERGGAITFPLAKQVVFGVNLQF